jgi:hypothetical protein
MERHNLKKLNEVEVKEPRGIELLSRATKVGLENYWTEYKNFTQK